MEGLLILRVALDDLLHELNLHGRAITGTLFHDREEASCKADEKSPGQQREVARTKNLALKSRVLCGG